MALSSYAVPEYCQVNENVDAIFKQNTQKKKEGGGIIAVLAIYMAIYSSFTKYFAFIA